MKELIKKVDKRMVGDNPAKLRLHAEELESAEPGSAEKIYELATKT